jgi:hypothetical protein
MSVVIAYKKNGSGLPKNLEVKETPASTDKVLAFDSENDNKPVFVEVGSMPGGAGGHNIYGPNGEELTTRSGLQLGDPVADVGGRTVVNPPNKNFLNYITDKTLWPDLRSGVCTTNLDAYFTALNASLVDGDVLVIPPGKYFTTIGLKFTSKSDITIYAYGVTFVCDPDIPERTNQTYTDRSIDEHFGLGITSSTNCRIYGLLLDGNDTNVPAGSWYNSGYVRNSTDVVLIDCGRTRDKGGFRFMGSCVRCGVVRWKEYNNHWGVSVAKYIGYEEFIGTGLNDFTPSAQSFPLENIDHCLSRNYLLECTYSGTDAVTDPDKFRWTSDSNAVPIVWENTDVLMTSVATELPETANPLGYPGVSVKWDSAIGHTVGDKWKFTNLYTTFSRMTWLGLDRLDPALPILESRDNFADDLKYSSGNMNQPTIRSQHNFTFRRLMTFPATEALGSFIFSPQDGTDGPYLADNYSFSIIDSKIAFIDSIDTSDFVVIDNVEITGCPVWGVGIYTSAGKTLNNISITNLRVANINSDEDGNQLPIDDLMYHHAGVSLYGPGTINNLVVDGVYIDQSLVEESTRRTPTTGITACGLNNALPAPTIHNAKLSNIHGTSNITTLISDTLLPYVSDTLDTLNTDLTIYATAGGATLQEIWDSIPNLINANVYIVLASGDYSGQTTILYEKVFLNDDKKIRFIGAVNSPLVVTTLASDYAQAVSGDYCLLNTVSTLSGAYVTTYDGVAYFVETCPSASELDGYSGVFNVVRGKKDSTNLYVQGSHNINTNNVSIGSIPAGSKLQVFTPEVILGTIAVRAKNVEFSRCKTTGVVYSTRLLSAVTLSGCHLGSFSASNGGFIRLNGSYAYADFGAAIGTIDLYRSLVCAASNATTGTVHFQRSLGNIGAGTEIYAGGFSRPGITAVLNSYITILASSAIGVQVTVWGSTGYQVKSSTYSTAVGTTSVNYEGSTYQSVVDGEFDENSLMTLNAGLVVNGAAVTANAGIKAYNTIISSAVGFKGIGSSDPALLPAGAVCEANTVGLKLEGAYGWKITFKNGYAADKIARWTASTTASVDLNLDDLSTVATRVIGPSSVASDALAAFDGTTGKLVKSCVVTKTALEGFFSRSWTDVLSSRSVGTEYPTTSAGLLPYPIELNILMSSTATGTWNPRVWIGTTSGALVNIAKGSNVAAGAIAYVSVTIPANHYYKVDANSGTGTFNTFTELR